MKVDYFTIPEITVSYKDRVKPSERIRVLNSADTAKILAVAFYNCMQHHEEVNVLYLNKANRVLGISNVAKGGIENVTVDIKIILQTALKASASAIIVSHNHPSGNFAPSQIDLDLTKRIKNGCDVIGIKLIDHMIITEEAYYSFSDEGRL